MTAVTGVVHALWVQSVLFSGDHEDRPYREGPGLCEGAIHESPAAATFFRAAEGVRPYGVGSELCVGAGITCRGRRLDVPRGGNPDHIKSPART